MINNKYKNAIYIINNPVEVFRLVNAIAKELNVEEPKKNIPSNVGYNLAKISDLIGRLTYRSMPFNSNLFFELTNEKIYDGSLVSNETLFRYDHNIVETVKKLANRYKAEWLL